MSKMTSLGDFMDRKTKISLGLIEDEKSLKYKLRQIRKKKAIIPELGIKWYHRDMNGMMIQQIPHLIQESINYYRYFTLWRTRMNLLNREYLGNLLYSNSECYSCGKQIEVLCFYDVGATCSISGDRFCCKQYPWIRHFSRGNPTGLQRQFAEYRAIFLPPRYYYSSGLNHDSAYRNMQYHDYFGESSDDE